ncbi:MAG: type II toxin-antitoxin system Phd/YefM family antitoxin [Planctomycetes bacterium]|nr:type II toxin-antitoxin system Phd/YefM family antitoxin [Planctomycetota bacterium]
MKMVTVEEFRANPDRHLADTADGDVILTQNGQPWVVLRRRR